MRRLRNACDSLCSPSLDQVGTGASSPTRNSSCSHVAPSLHGVHVGVRAGKMVNHGFARRSVWTCVKQEEGAATFELRPTEASLAMWPHQFVLTYDVNVQADSLTTTLTYVTCTAAIHASEHRDALVSSQTARAITFLPATILLCAHGGVAIASR